MTKFHVVHEVNKIIKSYAIKYNKKCNVHSLWYFGDDGELVICTDRPGIWVGQFGADVYQLKCDLNVAIENRNARLQLAYEKGQLDFKPDSARIFDDIRIIECNF